MAGSQISRTRLVRQATLNRPTSVVIAGIDKPRILDQTAELARTFRPMDEQQVAALLAQAAETAEVKKPAPPQVG